MTCDSPTYLAADVGRVERVVVHVDDVRLQVHLNNRELLQDGFLQVLRAAEVFVLIVAGRGLMRLAVRAE